MSKCVPNWQRLPNSRMDQQHRPRQFFRGKDRVDSIDGYARARNREIDREWARLQKMKEAAGNDAKL